MSCISSFQCQDNLNKNKIYEDASYKLGEIEKKIKINPDKKKLRVLTERKIELNQRLFQMKSDLPCDECRIGDLYRTSDFFGQEEWGSRETLLTLAARTNNLTLTKNLLKRGVNPNVGNLLGVTALHLAAENGDSPLCKLLMKHGAVTCISDSLRYTPFHRARRHGYKHICSLFPFQ